jgi:hypothetical protein
MEFLKSVVGKVVTGIVALAVVAGGISWWRMDPGTRAAVVSGTGHALAWLGLVLALPWVGFLVITWVARRQSNLAGAVLVAALTAVEAGVLAWLFHASLAGAAAWVFFAAGVAVAGVYNLLACDWIAEKLE